jgi:predicted DNA-binding transcriptional regulator AlpA
MTDTTTSHRRIGAAEVRTLCGGVSDMTLWRWLEDETLGFPRPAYIARRRYWRESDILDWLEAKAAEPRPVTPATGAARPR